MPANLKEAYLEMVRQNQIGFTPEAMEYVYHLVRGATSPGKEPAHLDPLALCRLFQSRMQMDFGAMAPMVSNHWGIHSSGDLGLAVLNLGEQGCLSLGPADTLEAFMVGGAWRWG